MGRRILQNIQGNLRLDKLGTGQRKSRPGQGIRMLKTRESLGRLVQHQRPNMVPTRGQESQNDRRNCKGKKPATLFPQTNANLDGETQLHLVNVPVLEHF
jgi:hypothetical protein